MNVNIIGDGAFGRFLRELLAMHCEITTLASTVIMAVPISAYEDIAAANRDKHLVNVCSVQEPSTDMVLKYTRSVTSIHPLFGARTPADKRHAIVTRLIAGDPAAEREYRGAEQDLIDIFARVSTLHFNDLEGKPFTPASHDRLMARTHAAAVLAARDLHHYVEAAGDVPDEYIPNSFRLMRDFVRTLEDTPAGTIESIMANPYINLSQKD